MDTGTLANARLPTTITGLSSLTSTSLVGDHTGNTTATGNITTTGNVTASSAVGLGFFGNGRNLTSLTATNIDSGTLNNARLPTNVNVNGTINSNSTLTASALTSLTDLLVGDAPLGSYTSVLGGNVTAKNQIRVFPTDVSDTITLTNGNVTTSSAVGKGFFGNGRNITSLSATNVDTGTMNNARLPTNVNIGGTLNANGTTSVVDVNLGGNIQLAGQPTFGASTGDGATYTVYNNFVGSWFGLAVRCAFDSTVRHVFNTRNGNLDMTGTCTAAAFSGNGSALTGLSATNIGTGTLNNARLPTNVNVAGTLNANGATSLVDATLTGNLQMGSQKQVRLYSTTTYIDSINDNSMRFFASGATSGVFSFTPKGVVALTISGDGTNTSTTATGNITTTANVTASSAAGLGFFGNGRNVTSLSATNVDSGTLNNARLPTNVDVAGTLNANLAATFRANVNLQTPAFAGGGNPSFIDTGFGQSKETNAGVIAYRRFTSDSLDIIGATADGVVTSGDRRIWMTDKVAMGGSNALGTDDTVKIHGNLTVVNTATATTFSGSGASLTALAANQVSTGQLNNARLPSAISVATSLQANSTITLSGTSTSNLYNDAGVLFTRYAAGQSSSTDYFISRGGTTPYAFGNVLLIHTPSAVTDAAVVIGTSGGVVRMKVDSVTGNVGIGNSAPAHTLAVNGTAYVSGQLLASNHSVTGTTTYLSAAGLSVLATNPDSTQYGMVGMLQRTNAGNVGLTLSQAGVSSYGILHPNGGGLTFVDNRWPSNLGSAGAGGAGTERMRIDTAGNVGIANSAPVHNLAVNGTAYVSGAATFTNDVILNNAGTGYITRNATVVGSGNMHITFVRTGGGSLHSVNFTSNVVTCSGELYSTGNVRIGSATAAPYQLDLTADTARKLTTSTWATGSDARVKSNVEYANLDVCYDVVKAVPLRRFEWDAAQYPDVQDRTVVGWIAQEVEAVFPKAVSSSSERGFDDFRTLSVDQLYKTMYGALQKVIADKEMLEARVAALEN